MPKCTPQSDYEAKISHEATRTVRRAQRRPDHSPKPFGDPLSGVVLVAEPLSIATASATASAGLIDALRRSLAAVKLDEAYVVWPSEDLLETILSLEPSALVAVGPVAARTIDALNYPLAGNSFSGAPEGAWFSWARHTMGLRLPALAPALADLEAKRRFWSAFLALRAIGPEADARR